MARVNQEAVEYRLGRADHVLCWHNEVNDGVVQLHTLPTVSRLIALLVPVEHLRDLIAHRAKRAPPTIPTINEFARTG